MFIEWDKGYSKDDSVENRGKRGIINRELF